MYLYPPSPTLGAGRSGTLSALGLGEARGGKFVGAPPELTRLRAALLSRLTDADLCWVNVPLRGGFTIKVCSPVRVKVSAQELQPVARFLDGPVPADGLYLYVPMDANDTNRLALQWNVFPLTRAVADQAHNVAVYVRRPSKDMSQRMYDFVGYSQTLHLQKDYPLHHGVRLVSGAHKLWILSAKGAVINHGFHALLGECAKYIRTCVPGPLLDKRFAAIQDMGGRHNAAHWDYSQLLQLMTDLRDDKGQPVDLCGALLNGHPSVWDEHPAKLPAQRIPSIDLTTLTCKSGAGGAPAAACAFMRSQRFGGGFGEPPPASDSPVANAFTEAHRSRWCVPGQANSETCRGLAAPRPIRRVIIHTIASAPENDCQRFARVNDVIRGWQNPGREASAHYLVDRDGTITQMVREANVAFHVIGNNQDSIGIEHADICNKAEALTTDLYERSAALVRDIAARNGFAMTVFGIHTNDPAAATVIGHQALRDHSDPGPYWDWEYYARLLRWDGRTPATRPLRLVSMISPGAAVPAGWQARSRVQVQGEARACIPNTHCADSRHSYSDTYWRAAAGTPGADVVFGFSVNRPGLYKISLWWPQVQGANPVTFVLADIQKAGGPAGGNATFDQTRNHGRWNDFGPPFTFTVPATGAQGTVRIRRASTNPGAILADAIRILKVG